MSEQSDSATEHRPTCDNPSCPLAADYEVTVHYPRGDIDGYLCEQHSTGDIVTRNRYIGPERGI